MRTLLTVCMLTALAAANPAAQSPDELNKELREQFERGTKYAVLIGIDKYEKKPLNGPVANVKILQEVLPRHGGFAPANISVLLDEAATKAAIFAAIKKAAADLKPEDTILIAFNGHGSEAGGASYYMSVDIEPKRVRETGVSLDEVRTILQACKASRKIVFIEACHSGSDEATSSQELSASLKKAGGLLTFASCRLNQRSLGHKGQGIFTAVLADGLAGSADFDKNGIVDSEELYRHLVEGVPSVVKQIAPYHDQLPMLIRSEDIKTPFALSRPDGKDDRKYLKIPPRRPAGEVIANSIGMKLVYLPNEIVVVGSPKTEYLRNDDEMQQPVYISPNAYMGVHEVTQDQYRKVMGKNPSYYSADGSGADAVAGMKTGSFPVEQVSWDEAVEFCKKLSALPEEQQAGRKYRLPTECEWEFACRAGKQTAFSTGERLSSKQANIRGDKTYLDSEEGPTLGRTAAVGSYTANAFGLHDMHGNVAEWCSDFYIDRRFPTFAAGGSFAGHDNRFKAMMEVIDGAKEIEKKTGAKPLLEAAAPLNPKGPKEGRGHVYRGGGFIGEVAFARSAARREKAADYTYRAIGFRVVCEPYIK